MKLRQFLAEIISDGCPFTIGTEQGEGWVYYYDGKNRISISDDYLDRKIENIYLRDGREKNEYACELKEGLAIIVEGYENGEF